MELLLQDWFGVVVFFIFGSIIGSFLNVYIYRLHTSRSLSGQSHCLSCQTPLTWYELLPLISYIVLRGRCRSCHSYIPARYFVVEFCTAIGFTTIAYTTGSLPEIVIYCALFALLVVIAVYDIYHLVIPDEFVVVALVIGILQYAFLFYSGVSFWVLVPALGSAAAAFLFFGTLWKVSHGRWIGFGDAKLAIPLGLMVSFPGVFSMIVLSFWVGAVVSLVLLGLQKLAVAGKTRLRFFKTQLTMSSEVPFAPFLIAGFILAHFFSIDVLTLVPYVL